MQTVMLEPSLDHYRRRIDAILREAEQVLTAREFRELLRLAQDREQQR